MQRHLLFIILFLAVFNALYSQVNEGCIFIDFETLPDGNPNSGVTISDQYKEAFGLTFKLEDGTSPVIARRGGQTEAFSSQWGGDTPAPGIDIGTFFLTDDGQTFGSTTPPLILEFEIPIDSFSGCILDLDDSEMFVIEAFDENNNLILSETIRNGDPNTGDGQLTCWGFNLPGCEGSIHKIIYTGTRSDFASFGLGLDNFSFCYSGLNIDFVTTDFSCNQAGEIFISNLTPGTYEYSVNGIDFTQNNVISGLNPGSFNLTVRDAEGCDVELGFDIQELSILQAEIVINPTSCNESNGQIIINAMPSNTPQYSLNGGNLQAVNTFSNLEAGTYDISIVDANGCEFDTTVAINPSEDPPIILAVESTPDFCNMQSGSINVIAEGGTGNLTYDFGLSSIQEENNAENLPQGNYLIVVTDALNCSASAEVNIPSIENLEAVIKDVVSPNCTGDGGQFRVELIGMNRQVQYSIDGINYQDSPIFTNLSTGEYIVKLRDLDGCELELMTEIPCVECEIFVPNVFAKTETGNNIKFQIFTSDSYETTIEEYKIYDRWGNLIYNKENFPIHNGDDRWWDGYYKNEIVENGVYAYLIVLKDDCGNEKILTGGVNFLR